MNNPEPTRRRSRLRFSLRALFVLVTLFACFLAYEVNWIRRRHKFLEDQDQLTHALTDATWDINYDFPKVEILPGRVEAPGFLWIFGEETLPSLDVLVVQQDNQIDPERPADSYEEVRTAHSLIPEAQIVAAIIPAEILDRVPPDNALDPFPETSSSPLENGSSDDRNGDEENGETSQNHPKQPLISFFRTRILSRSLTLAFTNCVHSSRCICLLAHL